MRVPSGWRQAEITEMAAAWWTKKLRAACAVHGGVAGGCCDMLAL